MTLADYLSETFVRNALIAATLVALTAGLIGPLVIVQDLAFAVHGTSELAFTGAAAGLLVVGDPLLGALLGSIVVATAIGLLGDRQRERNSAIGVILAITPAAAAGRLSARTPVIIAISIAFALLAADGGLLLNLAYPDVKASVFISAISFGLYVVARMAERFVTAPRRGAQRQSFTCDVDAVRPAVGTSATAPSSI